MGGINVMVRNRLGLITSYALKVSTKVMLDQTADAER